MNLRNNDIQEEIKKNSTLVPKYINWLKDRNDKAINQIPLKQLIALEAGHFEFATMIYEEAEKNIVSTSIVNPEWYDLNRCRTYIEEQERIIAKGKKFTRIFFIDSKQVKENSHIRVKTFEIIERLLQKGFHIKVSITPPNDVEQDIAIIDDKYAVEAIVPIDEQTKLPKPEFEQAFCYFKDSAKFNEIKGYLKRIEDRADNIDLSPNDYKSKMGDLATRFLSNK